MRYLFTTETTMKPYNYKKWWIDRNVVKEMRIHADSLSEAIKEYARRCNNDHCIEISKSALKNKQKMYRDTADGAEQVGYVITGKTIFDSGNGWSDQYIELWVEIMQLSSCFEVA